MFSLSSHLALNNSSMLHSFVDSFFLGKKALVKDRLRQSMETIVDGLFEEMVEQVKEMLLPPKESSSNGKVKSSRFESTTTTTDATSAKTETGSLQVTENLKKKMIFATKFKSGPSPSSTAPQPFSGLFKRMAEEDGVSTSSNTSHPNKKKAVTVELQIDGPLDDKNDYGDVVLDEGASDASYAEQLMNSSSDGAIDNFPSTSKELHQPAQSGKYPCTEPSCSKSFKCNADLKRHLRTHNKAKPFGCTYDGCSLEFGRRHDALRHILNVHLKKKKPGDDEEGNENNNEPPDPATYLSVKEELL